MAKARTLYDKIWDDHVVDVQPDGTTLLYIDRHLVHEVTSPQAFEGLRLTGRKVRAPERTLLALDYLAPLRVRDRQLPLPHRPRHEHEYVADKQMHIYIFSLARRARRRLGKPRESTYDLGAPKRLALGGLKKRISIWSTGTKHLQEPNHPGQRIVELVRQARRELRYRRELTRLNEAGLRSPQLGSTEIHSSLKLHVERLNLRVFSPQVLLILLQRTRHSIEGGREIPQLIGALQQHP